MAWLPIASTVPQYVDSNGDPYSGAVLKAYSDGTSTNINFATDDVGGTEVSSIALDSNGNPSVTGSVVIPHIQEKYKLALYATQTAADADSGAIWAVDDITPPDLTDTNTDVLVTVSSNDTTGGYLNGKLVAGANVSLTEGSDGGNETLTVALDTAFQDGHIYGLGTSRETINDINIAVGSCVDATNAFSMDLTTTITKQIDANWAEGDDAGGFPSGLTVTVGTWYHLYLIAKTDGTVDAGFDSIAGEPTNLLSDASAYTYYRRIGSVLTDSGTASTIMDYSQFGDLFAHAVPVRDLNGTPASTNAIPLALTTPLGVEVLADIHGYFNDTASGTVLITSLDQTDTTPDTTVNTLRVTGTNSEMSSVSLLVKTNTSRQIRYRSSEATNSTLMIWTNGWTDARGK